MKKFLLLFVGVLFALSANAEIYLRGNFNGQDKWNSTDYEFKQQSGNTYILDLSGKLSFSPSDKFVIYDTYTRNYHQANGNSDATNVGEVYQTWENSNNDLHMSKAVENPYIELNISNWTITITNKSTTHSYYLLGNLNGDSSKWSSEEYAFQVQKDGSYTLDLSTSYATLNANSEIKIFDKTDGKWYGRYNTTDDSKYIYTGVEYTLGDKDNIFVNANISNPQLRLVVDGENLKLTISAKEAATDYTIYFDAVRSGWESLSVIGVDATIVDDAKALKKITYSAVEGTEISLSNGTDSYPVTPSNDHVYYFDSSLQDGGVYANYTYTPPTPPTPAVVTSYTIYFDTLQSGWRKVALFNDGVEVVGSLEKRGYIHGAQQDGVEGYLHKYTVNTTDASKLTFTNGSDSYSLKTITDGNVYYVSEGALAGAALGTYKVNADPSYRLHGSIVSGSWDTYPMTYRDGLWIYEANDFKSGDFGIKQIGPDEAVNEYNPWIHASSSGAKAVTVGVATQGKVKVKDDGGSDFSSSVTGKSTLVFDPAIAPNNPTVMFINPAAATTNLTQVEVDTYSHANKLEVTITPSNYTSTTGDLTLSNGTFTATSSTGTFSNVPYASNYTLTTSKGTAMPINITLPTEPTFDISRAERKAIQPAEGQTNGILYVFFPVTTTWTYNLPHVICTCNGRVVNGDVKWATGGFVFEAAEAIPLIGTAVATDMTFNFVITPEYPFMVNVASPRGQMRVAGTGIQNVLGTAVTAVATFNGGSEVSGVEGVMIEDEEAPVEYFNLQGQRVNGELAPGIYIRRQGTTVTKVRI